MYRLSFARASSRFALSFSNLLFQSAASSSASLVLSASATRYSLSFRFFSCSASRFVSSLAILRSWSCRRVAICFWTGRKRLSTSEVSGTLGGGVDVVLLGPTPGLEESRIGICVGTLAVGRISDASERRYGGIRTIGGDAVVVITSSGRSTRFL